jgi:drug/metabolite transporter (DMT)-like permease
MAAFAANSLLCREALRGGAIDPASFSAVRIASGAAMLAVLVALRGRRAAPTRDARSAWPAALALVGYAVPFSFAYLSLGAGTGALLLFGAVQLTMVAGAVRAGRHPTPLQWLGLITAFGGLVYLVRPGLTAPSPLGAALMVAAGVAWGLYSLMGHGTADALGRSAGNFARGVPLVLLVAVTAWPTLHAERSGLLWAVLSGAVASGLGYALWYQALRALSSVTAAAVQLSVPLLAGLGGVLLLDERLTLRLGVASALVLGGIGVTIAARARGAISS